MLIFQIGGGKLTLLKNIYITDFNSNCHYAQFMIVFKFDFVFGRIHSLCNLSKGPSIDCFKKDAILLRMLTMCCIKTMRRTTTCLGDG